MFCLSAFKASRLTKKINQSIAQKTHLSFLKFKVFKEMKQRQKSDYETQLTQLNRCTDRLSKEDLLRYDFRH